MHKTQFQFTLAALALMALERALPSIRTGHEGGARFNRRRRWRHGRFKR